MSTASEARLLEVGDELVITRGYGKPTYHIKKITRVTASSAWAGEQYRYRRQLVRSYSGEGLSAIVFGQPFERHQLMTDELREKANASMRYHKALSACNQIDFRALTVEQLEAIAAVVS
jgi:hypothetical protein